MVYTLTLDKPHPNTILRLSGIRANDVTLLIAIPLTQASYGTEYITLSILLLLVVSAASSLNMQ